MNKKIEAIFNLFKSGKIDINGVKEAVNKGIISEEEFFEITGEKL